MTWSGEVTGVPNLTTWMGLQDYFLLNAKIIVPEVLFIIFTQKKYETDYTHHSDLFNRNAPHCAE
jgi:hypothetical protein